MVELTDALGDDDAMVMVPTVEAMPNVEDGIDKEKTVEDTIGTETPALDETLKYG